MCKLLELSEVFELTLKIEVKTYLSPVLSFL